MNVDLGLRGVE